LVGKVISPPALSLGCEPPQSPIRRGNHVTTKSTFVYLLRLVRPESLRKMSPEEEAVIDEHFEYLKKRLAEGHLLLAGRCLNREFGIVIFHAESEEKAREFMRNDPAVKKAVMTAELHPFRIALIESS
jgi:uncharacterized protein YciI